MVIDLLKDVKSTTVSDMDVTSTSRTLDAIARSDSSVSDKLREFIDNSIGAGADEVSIHLIDKHFDNGDDLLLIEDNGNGFPSHEKEEGEEKSDLEEAITVGGDHNIGNINEHGVGMKRVMRNIGEMVCILTKSPGGKWRRINPPVTDPEVEYFDECPEDFDYEHGSRIAIRATNVSFTEKLKDRSGGNGISKTGYCQKLGTIYRKYIDDDELDITLEVTYDDPDLDDKSREVEAWKPFIYNPTTGKTGEIIDIKFSGDGWRAIYKMGAKMPAHVYEDLVVNKEDGKDKEWYKAKYCNSKGMLPIAITQVNQGGPIVHCKRDIEYRNPFFMDLHSTTNYLYEEIILKEGFETTQEKDGVNSSDNNFHELKKKIIEFRKGEKWRKALRAVKRVNKDSNSKGISRRERQLTKDLASGMKNGNRSLGWMFDDSDSVQSFYSLGGLGEIDILTDKYIIEVKTDYIDSATQFTQFFAYLDEQEKLGKRNKVVIIAHSFSDSVREKVESLEDYYDEQLDEIVLVSRDDLPEGVLAGNSNN